MAAMNPPVLKYPDTGHMDGGRPPGYGGDNGGAGSGPEDYGERLRRARLGLAAGVLPVIMLFVAFTSAYIVRQGLPTLDARTNQYVRDWLPVNLPISLMLINTFILLGSSISMELARRQITRRAALAPVASIPGVTLGKERHIPWLAVTIVLGLAFLAGQWEVWQELAARGFYLATSASSSFVYLLTAAHAVHLMGGIIAMLSAGLITLLHRPLEKRRIVVDITAWYWHFMAVLWIYIFALLAIAR
jgi:cytochrome c oxidase subunit 3